jgi:glycosyltransferase involved in cell wall biosynthesis
MKLAFFYNVAAGGALRVVEQQVAYLSKKHTVDIYTFTNTQNQKDIDPLEHASHVFDYSFSLEPHSAFLPKRLGKDIQNFFTLKKVHKNIAKDIDKKGYDAVVVHPDMYTQAPFLLQFLQTPSVYYCHEWLRIVYEKELAFTQSVMMGKRMYEYVTRAYRKHIDKTNTQKATYIVANSKFTQNHVKQAYGRDAIVCYPGVDPTIFKPTNEKKIYDLFFVGAKDFINGYTFLQEIVSKYPQSLKVQYLQDNEDIFVSDNDLRVMYNKSKIVMCLSYNEPFGIVPLEAMSCGIPVLAVAQGGYKETITTGKTGYILPRDEYAFCEKIEKLLTNVVLAKELGKSGREEIMKHWTWEIHVRNFERQLQGFLNKR